ncbi:hypothetical protein HY463_01425 [Candidatus Peregrinibacteria bacterium]|nr:hypothetical protein [Candidatus Peregrinibacteria bacterium]
MTVLQPSLAPLPLLKLNLMEVIEDMFMVLSEKERDVVVKRFSLDNKERQTLESIGRSFNVTRERVRQIEKIALSKLKRTVNNTKLKYVNEVARTILKENGGIMLEQDFLAKVLLTIDKAAKVDAYIVRLALTISPDMSYLEKTNLFTPSWHLVTIPVETVQRVLNHALSHLKNKKDVVAHEDMHKELKNSKIMAENIEDAFFASIIKIDQRIKSVEEGYGLMAWRHVNPKSIRDKAYIVLKKNKKPLHFVDIANKIIDWAFDKKVVTVQAVHNELIRYPQFVLVGRGLYALKEWGYQDGTVADIIQAILEKKSPISKQEITRCVLKQRQVKKGTISLNLQKNKHFIRVGRAMYALDLSKK